MPYCVQCGQQVGDRDKFCAKCGKAQKDAKDPDPIASFWDSLSIRNAILFCYIPWIGWLTSIAILASPRFRAEKRVRFHAFQGLYLFAAWLMVQWVLGPMLIFAGPWGARRFAPQMLQLAVFAGWVFMIIKASHDEDYHLPVIGQLAERSAAEQS